MILILELIVGMVASIMTTITNQKSQIDVDNDTANILSYNWHFNSYLSIDTSKQLVSVDILVVSLVLGSGLGNMGTKIWMLVALFHDQPEISVQDYSFWLFMIRDHCTP